MVVRLWVRAVGVLAVGLGACTRGYMKASALEAKEQGPSHCAARCEELGMRMAALVLVSNALPGCVCQPRYKAPPPANDDSAEEGASAATTGYVVLAAAAAAARQQQQQRQQQTYSHK